MLHHQEFNSNNLSSCSPTYKIHSRRASTGDGEFNFWGSRKSIYVENFSDHITDGDLEFQAKAQMDQDGFGVYSSPLWEANTSKDIKCESSTCYELSEYRRELMKMIHNMPESCYELSLKDIVDEKHGLQEVEEKIVIQDRNFHLDTEAQVEKHKKKKINSKTGQLSRIGSMEIETFLIKLFFPTSLGANKKAKAVNRSKVSGSSSKRSEDHIKTRNMWITRFVLAGLNKSIFRESMSSSTGSSNSHTIRCTEINFIPGCWSFLPSKKKSKNEGQRGCMHLLNGKEKC